MKNIVILLGSPHANGNTSVLAEAFLRGIQESGGTGEIIRLSQKKIGYCLGCNYCRANGGACVQKDDMPEILEKIIASDGVVFASPLYFMDMSAQIRTCIDRFYGPFHAKKLADCKKAAMLVTSGGPSEAAAMPNINGTFEALVKLLGWENCGYVWTGGHREPGSIGKSDAVQQAYELGKKF